MDDVTKLNKWWHKEIEKLNKKLDKITEDKDRAVVLARTSTALSRAVLRELRSAEVAVDTEGSIDAVEARLRVLAAIRRVEVHNEGLRDLLVSLALRIDSDEANTYNQLELTVERGGN